jgi:hypothetical protein
MTVSSSSPIDQCPPLVGSLFTSFPATHRYQEFRLKNLQKCLRSVRRNKTLLCAISGCEQLQQTAKLFDHLVGARKHARRHFEAKRLGGGQVDENNASAPITSAPARS